MPGLEEEALRQVLRREAPLVIAHVNRLVRDLNVAEDILGEVLASSVAAWQRAGLPPNPGAYLMKAARNRAIDVLRRENKVSTWNQQHAAESAQHQEAIDEGDVFPDERLRMVFTCCHPSIALEAQVALTLRLVCGLTTAEVARAFLVSEPTIAQRLVRAKRHIADARIAYEVPHPEELAERLFPALHVFLLVFNEGYTSSSGDSLTRVDLMDEGLRLTSLVLDALPDEPEVRGVLALMQLLASRAHTRVDGNGAIVLLEAQDRSLWNQDLIRRGLDNLHLAAARGNPGPFQLQAHIAATHAAAPSWEATDWVRIGHLYRALEIAAPSPVVTLNRAVAVSMVEGPEAGLRLLESVEASHALREYHLLFATRGDFLRRLGRLVEARAAYVRAASLTANTKEKEFLERRAAACLPAG